MSAVVVVVAILLMMYRFRKSQLSLSPLSLSLLSLSLSRPLSLSLSLARWRHARTFPRWGVAVRAVVVVLVLHDKLCETVSLEGREILTIIAGGSPFPMNTEQAQADKKLRRLDTLTAS